MKKILAAVIACCLPLSAAAQNDYPDLSGLWHYSILRSPEYCVRITRTASDTVDVRYLLRDHTTGDELEFGSGRGRFVSHYELRVWGQYTRSLRRTRKGVRFESRWLIFDSRNKIQVISYWGVYRDTSYLVRDGAPYS